MTFGFRRHGEVVRVRLSAVEAALLRDLAGQVIGVVERADRSDPVVARLFPDAHRDDAEVAREFRRLTEDDLRAGKAAAARRMIDAVPAAGGRVALALADADEWLAAINDIRLALGVRLDVTEEGHDRLADLDPADPRHDGLRVYEWLGALQETLVDALNPQ